MHDDRRSSIGVDASRIFVDERSRYYSCFARPHMLRPALVLTADEKTRLAHKVFSETDLTGVDFAGANLRYARFENVCLIGANFARADLRSAQFHRCDLRGATFEGASWGDNVLHESLFAGAIGFNREQAMYVQCCGGSFFSLHT